MKTLTKKVYYFLFCLKLYNLNNHHFDLNLEAKVQSIFFLELVRLQRVVQNVETSVS